MKRIEFSEHADKIIRNAYQTNAYCKGSVIKAAKVLGISMGSIHRRALALGVLGQERKRQHRWEDWQLNILLENSHKSLSAINAMIVRRGGESRAESAIYTQMQKMRIKVRQARIDAGCYSACEAARILGVNDAVVLRYINSGMLKAKVRPDVNRNERLITDADLRELLINHAPSISFAKIDKYWLAEQIRK